MLERSLVVAEEKRGKLIQQTSKSDLKFLRPHGVSIEHDLPTSISKLLSLESSIHAPGRRCYGDLA